MRQNVNKGHNKDSPVDGSASLCRFVAGVLKAKVEHLLTPKCKRIYSEKGKKSF